MRAFKALLLALALPLALAALLVPATATTAHADDAGAMFQWTDTNGGERACWYPADCADQILSEIESHTYAEGTHGQWQGYYEELAGLEQQLWQRISTWDDAQGTLAFYDAYYDEVAGMSYGPSSGAALLFKQLRDTAHGYVGVMFDPVSHVYLGPPPTPTPTPTPTPPVLSSFAKVYTPTVSGKTVVGQTLTAKVKRWSPAQANAWQWQRNSVDITGATGYNYRLRATDLGTVITVKLTGSKAGYSSLAKTSKATKAIKAGTLKKGKVKITGTLRVGKTITAKTYSTWSASVTFSYQWYRNSTKISGATAKTYTLSTLEKGKKMKVKVVATKPGYKSSAKTSKSTGKVK